MKIEPNGRTPPNITMAQGSMNLERERERDTCSLVLLRGGGPHHFFSGMGLGTVLTLQGLSGWPEMLLPRMVPTRLRGRITNRQMLATANCSQCQWIRLLQAGRGYHGEDGDGPRGVVVDGNKVDEEDSATDEAREEGGSTHHLLDPRLACQGAADGP